VSKVLLMHLIESQLVVDGSAGKSTVSPRLSSLMQLRIQLPNSLSLPFALLIRLEMSFFFFFLSPVTFYSPKEKRHHVGSPHFRKAPIQVGHAFGHSNYLFDALRRMEQIVERASSGSLLGFHDSVYRSSSRREQAAVHPNYNGETFL